jgi:hypothetical protein
MIRFYCEHCAHKISVRDEYTGRRGQCPKCGNVTIVPTESTVIEFRCEKCDRKITAPKGHAGKKAVCPKCNSTFIIPKTQFTGSDAARNDSGELIARTIDSPHDLTLIDVPEEYKLKDEPVGQYDASRGAVDLRQESEEDSQAEETESIGQRKLPWFIDILLYPISIPGLMHLGIFTIIPFFVSLVGILLGPFSMAIVFPSLLINIAIGLYICWYITECVRDSSKGGLRAPEAFATSGLGEMWSQSLHIIGCYLIFLGPALFYSFFSNKTDIVFWLLLAYGAFFFPMGLLACIMFDSVYGLNPLLLIGSIFSTFFRYCGLVLLISGIVLGFRAIQTTRTSNTQQGTFTTIIMGAVYSLVLLYTALVVAHLIGRFFWRNQAKLNWEV